MFLCLSLYLSLYLFYTYALATFNLLNMNKKCFFINVMNFDCNKHSVTFFNFIGIYINFKYNLLGLANIKLSST